MNKVRIGIIGMGNMGRYHADYLAKGEVAGAELVAVCSPSPHKLKAYEPLSIWDNGEAMIRSGEMDAVIIATPHYQHTSLGIAALEAGVHLMVEKPISAHKADAERLIAKSQEKSNVVFGAMFQLRTEPRYIKIRKMIREKELGEIVRIHWTLTDWYRTQAYYLSGGWRATWKGEGGGVLINQCLHQLDVLAWIFGMPSRLHSFIQLGRYHDIEVEDDVTAFLEYETGMHGVLIASTGEAPGTNRFEIVGTRGRLVLENDQIIFTRNEHCMNQFSKDAKSGFAKPDVWNVSIPISNALAPHAFLMQNFVNSILDGEALLAPGKEGLASVELANAMLYSGLIGEAVEMPLSSSAFESKLNELIANSRFEKKVVENSGEDFAQSFKR